MSARKKLQIFLLVLTLAFIWGQSCVPKDGSAQESQRVMMFIAPFFSRFIDSRIVTVYLIRKLAHFVEFAILGFQIFLLCCRNMRKGVADSIGWGFAVAFLDESIQIFSNRGPQISDVWLDTGGVAFGVAIGALLILLVRRKRFKLQKE